MNWFRHVDIFSYAPFHTTGGTSSGRSFTQRQNRPLKSPISSEFLTLQPLIGHSFLIIKNSIMTVLETLVTVKQPQFTFGSHRTKT